MAMKNFRLRKMEQYILEKESASMEELCSEFEISMNTARLDVAELVEKGTIKKVYGGVTANRENALVPFTEREMKNAAAKKSVCCMAASFVEDGDIIYIDSGTTAMYMVDYLKEKKNITVLTHNLNAITRAVPLSELNVFSLPGNLDRRNNSFVSADTARILERYNIKKAFIATAGVGADGTVTNSSPLEFEVKKAAMANAYEKYLLLDASKYGRTSLMTFAKLSDMTRVIVDSGITNDFRDYCAMNNVALSVAPKARE